MAEKKRKPGRPPLGGKALMYPLRMRLPNEIGEELEKQAKRAGKSAPELAREDIVAGVKRRRRSGR